MSPLHTVVINLFFSLLLSAHSSLQQNITSSSNSTSINDEIIVSKPGCPRKCGNLTVPYPFGVGIGSNCSMNPWFDVYCDPSVDPPYMLVSTRDDYRLVDISESQIRIKNPFFASRCYKSTITGSNLTLDFSGSPYTLSDSNRLTQVGCSDLAVLEGFSKQFAAPNLTQNNFASGCVSFCSDGDLSLNGSCPGNGCCQIPLPKGTVFLNSSITGLEDRWRNDETKPCSYSFIGEKDSFSFQKVSDLYSPPTTISDWLQGVTVALDWRIGTEKCREARNSRGFACQQNSDCIDTDAGVGGYRCSCSKGYQGNPYLPPGCQDIDECKSNPCHPTGLCINVPGDYTCGCPAGYFGDGGRNSSGCFPVTLTGSTLSKLSIGLITGMGFLTLLSMSLVLTKFVKKRKNNKRKQKFYRQNGGLLLQQQTSAKEGVLGKTRIFTAKELEKATDRFNESRILGRGGQGTVYKGMLSDGQIVAIKKSQLVDEHKSKHIVEQFINEVVILSQINHRNVVKLLGCCLETRVPLLVYEFVPNGTLFHHIHDDKNSEFPFSWNMRLKIAADVAGALAYLHSATSLPIYHRDVKSSNILLDEKYVAKVSDFGTSKTVAVDQTHLTTNVNGTFGYIDPEYFQSSQFTEKSDVYSFGVVLVELLSGLKPIIPSTKGEDDNRSLVSRFLSSMDENNLDSILDSQVSAEGEKEGVLAVAGLAKRCLHLNGKMRPNMKQVAVELETVRIAQTGSTTDTRLPEDSFYKERPKIFSTDNYNYTWTTTSDFPTNSSSDFPTNSSSDVYPIMFDTI